MASAPSPCSREEPRGACASCFILSWRNSGKLGVQSAEKEPMVGFIPEIQGQRMDGAGGKNERVTLSSVFGSLGATAPNKWCLEA